MAKNNYAWLTMTQALQLWERKVSPKLISANGCKLFTGAHTNGYGAVRANYEGSYTVTVYVHRLKLFIDGGEWPDETVHLCKNKHCVEHVLAGTHRENMKHLILEGSHNMVTPNGRRNLNFRTRWNHG